MKTVAILLVFAVGSYAFEDQCQGAFLHAVFEKCVLANGGDRVVIEDLVNLQKSRDENGKCFRACLMTECNYLSADRKLNDDVPTRLAHILHGGDESKVKAIEDATSKCMSQMKYEENVCNNAENFTRCLAKQCQTCGLKLYNVFK